jgi:hypothetical protein
MSLNKVKGKGFIFLFGKYLGLYEWKLLKLTNLLYCENWTYERKWANWKNFMMTEKYV